jgi:hypothetical protein
VFKIENVEISFRIHIDRGQCWLELDVDETGVDLGDDTSMTKVNGVGLLRMGSVVGGEVSMRYSITTELTSLR